VNANRGLIEYADLLKRPLEAFKYLLGFSETSEVPLEHMILQLDEVLIASSNEKHLSAFKELPDFASFKGRIELVRVPYLRRDLIEKQIYDAQITSTTVGKHVAPHATAVARVGGADAAEEAHPRPLPPGREGRDGRADADREDAPAERRRRRPSVAQAKELRKHRPAQSQPPSRTRGEVARRRGRKTAPFNAAQNPSTGASTPWRCWRSGGASRTRACTSSSSRRWWTGTTTTRSS
jgi:hypothetical protein